MADMSAFRKYNIILQEFIKRKELTAYDEVLQRELSLSTKHIGRLMDDLVTEFDNIIKIKEKGKKQIIYKLVKPLDLFVETFSQSEEIGWFFNMAHDADPEIFKGLEQYTNENKSMYKFKNSPFEDISSIEEKDVFKRLQKAVKNREYVKLSYNYTDEVYDNLKALKLLFIDNNWYIAIVDNENKLRLSRISFIKEVNYASKDNFFQPISVEKQMEFLENDLQNAMTLYDVPKYKAILKVSGFITRYFEEDMKKFFPSQKFIEKLDDGSVVFSIEYTQFMEIMPFIQSWMPNMTILEPQILKDHYSMKLKQMTDNLGCKNEN